MLDPELHLGGHSLDSLRWPEEPLRFVLIRECWLLSSADICSSKTPSLPPTDLYGTWERCHASRAF
jgi:hypothetical protein